MSVKLRNRDILLSNIASLYFIEKKTQAQIAKRMGYSRSAISRLISEAMDRGIVEIRVHSPIKRNVELESFLKNTFGVEEALVVAGSTASESERLREVGQLAAGYFEKYLRDAITIGIGWGTSIFEVVNALPNLSFSNVQIVQIIGAVAGKSDPKIDGPDLAALLARKLGGSHRFFHSPMILENEELKQSLINQPQIREVIELAYRAQVTLLGIGPVEPDLQASSLLRTGYVDQLGVQRLKEKGGTANFCGYILDEDGKLLDVDMNHRVMAVDLGDLRKSNSQIITVAAGRRKTRAIEAVLKGGYINVLVTDDAAIRPIFDIYKEREQNGE